MTAAATWVRVIGGCAGAPASAVIDPRYGKRGRVASPDDGACKRVARGKAPRRSIGKVPVSQSGCCCCCCCCCLDDCIQRERTLAEPGTLTQSNARGTKTH